ncbi:hypothetical protein KPL37_18190 [Clostridium frigoris]|uniref:Uncharacterized protein n=1 Tax=Clostridium frigoris TaxID=205327 RepID=A0ABS6BYE3_9CLOT|nr:hypothetical protein [Clostridium frigoris]MBU3161630.1 hypothetical protein [Clostridium frigoris]
MFMTYEVKINDISEANIEALKLAKDVLTEKVELTPYVVAEFTALSGFNDLEVFIRTSESEKNPFNNGVEYEEDIYYYLYETSEIIRVTYEEFDRLMKVFIEIEIDRGIYISKSEKEEYRVLIKA